MPLTRTTPLDRLGGLVASEYDNMRTGRFERTLAALTAVGAVITTLEIHTEHDSAGFGNKMMLWPIAILPTGSPQSEITEHPDRRTDAR